MLPNHQLQRKFQRLIKQQTPDVRLRLRHFLDCENVPINHSKTAEFRETTAVRVVLDRTKNKGRNARFTGIFCCHNKWACPTCAPRLLRQTAADVTAIIQHQKNTFNRVAKMVTLTVPHYNDESAVTVIARMKTAKAYWDKYCFTVWKQHYKNYGEPIDCGGSICATECRWSGTAGWHFHCHVLYFLPAEQADQLKADEKQLRDKYTAFTAQWRRNNEPALGIYISNGYTENGKYIAKEIIKTEKGTGRLKHSIHPSGDTNIHRQISLSPFDLLAADNKALNDKFIEFAQAIKGVHRVSMSRGVRTGVDFETAKKNLLNEYGVISTTVVASFTFSDWCEICNRDQYDNFEHDYKQGILTACELDGYSGIVDYCYRNGLPIPKKEDEVIRRNPAPPTQLTLFAC